MIASLEESTNVAHHFPQQRVSKIKCCENCLLPVLLYYLASSPFTVSFCDQIFDCLPESSDFKRK